VARAGVGGGPAADALVHRSGAAYVLILGAPNIKPSAAQGDFLTLYFYETEYGTIKDIKYSRLPFTFTHTD
jgi:hypothetical protein